MEIITENQRKQKVTELKNNFKELTENLENNPNGMFDEMDELNDYRDLQNCKQKAKEMIEKLGCGEDYIKENNGHRVRCSKNRLCQKCHKLKEQLEKIK